jgi:hypothetical protein
MLASVTPRHQILPNRSNARRRASTRLICAAIAVSFIGCASRKPPPEKLEGSGRFTSPPISIINVDGEHVIVANTPTSGWTIFLERDMEVHKGREIFLTLREPHSQFIVNKSPQEQRVGTGIAATTRIEVFARIGPHDAAPGGPFQSAASAPTR